MALIRRVSRLFAADMHAVLDQIEEPDVVLRQAIRWCGTSFSNYRDADDQRGKFQTHLRVYNREGKSCRVCADLIKRVTLGGRGAFYCPTCQK